MSRTINGNLTGKAASTYLKDVRESQDKYVLDLESKLRVKKEVYEFLLRDFGPEDYSVNRMAQVIADLQSAIEAEKEAERGRELFRSDSEDDMTDYNDLKRTQEEARM